MNMKRYALIGCGRVAPNHVAAAKAAGLEFAGLCDLDLKKAKAFREEMGLSETIPVYTDADRMMEAVRPDLVAIATSSGDHAKLALQAIRRGIHVIVEKPIALSLSDADEMIREAKANRVKLCVSHQNRFNPTIRCIHDAVSEGRLGRIMHGAADIRWFRGEDYYSQAAWRGTWKEDGGALMNQCIHDIDLLIWMLGNEPETVFGFTANQIHPYIEAEDLGMAVVRFKNGAIGSIEGTTDVYPNGLEETLTIFGEKGTVRAGGMSVNRMDVWNVQGEENCLEEIRRQCDENPENVYGNGHSPLYRDMIRAIDEDGEPLVNGEAGRKALEVILAIYRSSRTGEAVTLPMKEASTLEEVPFSER